MISSDSKTQENRTLQVVVAIPARYQSSRLPGKPLANIGGKTMIQRVCEQAGKAANVAQVLVATDDQRIFDHVLSFGGAAVMTRSDHISGTDRLAEVFQNRDADVVVNLQGDEPFLDPSCIEALIESFHNDPDLQFATLKTVIHDPDDLFDPTIAKLVVDENDHVLYFSRAPIPFLRDEIRLGEKRSTVSALPDFPLYKHIGIYAYKRAFLLRFASWEPAPTERVEKLEQLRALHHGVKVKAVTVEHAGISIDTPEDLVRAKRYLDINHKR